MLFCNVSVLVPHITKTQQSIFVTKESFFSSLDYHSGSSEQKMEYQGAVSHNKPSSGDELIPHQQISPPQSKKDTQQLQCPLCPSMFSDRGNLRRHITDKHHNNNWKKYACHLCDAKLSSQSALRNHKLIHGKPNRFKCTLCGHAFTQKANMEKHMLTHSGRKDFCCRECPATFARKAHLQGHLIVHNRNEKFKCSFCSASFPHQTRDHLISVHLAVTEPKCETCFENVKSPKEIKQTVSHGNNIKCEKCDNSYCNEVYLAIHISQHNLEKSCQICGKIFKSPAALRAHFLTHSNKRDFPCSLCPASFKAENKLRRHMNTVHSTKRVICPKCSKILKSTDNLKIHLARSHGDLKEYVCLKCPGGKYYHSKNALTKHITHKHRYPKKTYNCPACPDIKYSTANQLSRHIASKHGPQQTNCCALCNQTYASAMSLSAHKYYNHGSMSDKIACPKCHKLCNRGSLRTHLKRVHGKLQCNTCKVCSHNLMNVTDLRKHVEQKNHLDLPKCFVKLVRCDSKTS